MKQAILLTVAVILAAFTWSCQGTDCIRCDSLEPGPVSMVYCRSDYANPQDFAADSAQNSPPYHCVELDD